jgi:hypothetical protein
METSGAAKKKAGVMAANYYQNMCLAGSQSKFLKEIEQVGRRGRAGAGWRRAGSAQPSARLPGPSAPHGLQPACSCRDAAAPQLTAGPAPRRRTSRTPSPTTPGSRAQTARRRCAAC